MAYVFIIGIILYLFYLGSKVTRLEQELFRLRGGAPAAQQHASHAPSAQSQQSAPPTAAQIYETRQQAMGQPASTMPAHPPQPTGPSEADRFIAWVKEDFFVKLGAFLLIIAFAWFVNYAFANNWIGPVGRITLGLVIGVLVMGLGLWRIPTQKHQGGIFTVLGSTIVLLTVFAAREVYDFFTPASALALMFLAVLFVAFVSVRFKSERLAIAGLILAGVAPFLTNPPEPNALMLLSYLLIVILGTLWVVRLTGSNALTFAALVLTFLYLTPFWSGAGGREDELISLVFSFVFTGIFFVANLVGILQRQTENARKGQIVTAIGTGVLLMSAVFSTASPEWQSLLYIAWMLVFISGAFVVYTHTNYRVPFYIYAAVGIGLLGAATATELDGSLLTIAFALEATAIVAVAGLLLRDRDVATSLTTLFFLPGLLSFQHMMLRDWNGTVINEHFFALLVMMFTTLITGLILLKLKTEEDAPVSAIAMSVVGIAYLLILVWLVTHTLMPADTATFTSLVIYTILGLTLFIRGRLEADTALASLGGVLLGFVVLRLLLIDVWQMELFGRVITFAAVGVLLISTAFIRKNDKPTLTE